MELFSRFLSKCFFIFGFFAIIACDNEEQAYEAKLMEVSQIQSDPNFYWYDKEYDSYKLDLQTIKAIKDTLQSIDMSDITLVIFTAPSCFCGSNYIKFPQLMKVLDSAGITANNYQIFVTKDESVNFLHSYSDIIQVKSIPDFYVIKSRQNIFSIMDNLNGMATKAVEAALLEGLCATQQ